MKKLSEAQESVIRRLTRGDELMRNERVSARSSNGWTPWRWGGSYAAQVSSKTIEALQSRNLVKIKRGSKLFGHGDHALELTEKGKAYAAEKGWTS